MRPPEFQSYLRSTPMTKRRLSLTRHANKAEQFWRRHWMLYFASKYNNNNRLRYWPPETTGIFRYMCLISGLKFYMALLETLHVSN